MSENTSDYLRYFNDSLAAFLAPVAKSKASELAELITNKFKSVEGAFSAPWSDLVSCVGEKVAVYLKTASAVISRRICERFEMGVPHTRAEVADYFVGLYLVEDVEKVSVMLKDENDAVIDCRVVSEGTVNSSDILPRKIVQTAIAKGSKKIILAHNHPRGAAAPSEEDLKLTHGIADLLAMVGIRLEYHVIVAGMEANIIDN